MNKQMKRLLSVFISVAMLMTMFLPTAVFAAEDMSYVCYIGSTGYESLAAAVSAADPGDTVWMTADDAITEELKIDKSITIELEGYTLKNTTMLFSGNIDVFINDRIGTAKINTACKGSFYISSESYSPSGAFFLTGGARVTISGKMYGTEFYGKNSGSHKAFVVGSDCKLTLNGVSVLFSGLNASDGVFVCENGVLSIGNAYIARYDSSRIYGGTISYAVAPSAEYPLTITSGRFKGGMWLESSTVINGESFPKGTASFATIEKAFLQTSKGSYIDYEKSSKEFSGASCDIWIASNLSADTDIGNAVDTTEALRISAGGDVTAEAGKKVIFEPQIMGGDGYTDITYSWNVNDTVSDVNTAYYAIDAVRAADAGTYVLTATQGKNTVSAAYNLTVTSEPDEPPTFDFTSLRTLRTQSIAVDHETKTIDIIAQADTDYITVYEHQLDTIPGGTFKMASYMGHKVVYNRAGSYRIYCSSNPVITVKANIIIGDQTRQYLINITFPFAESEFSFQTLAGTGMESVTVDHEAGTIVVNADNASAIRLPIEQDEVFNGKFRMVSYMGNKVSLDQNTRIYTISRRAEPTIQVKVKIELGSKTKEYLMTINYVAVEWGFDTLKATNVSRVSVDHAAQTVTMDVTAGCGSILLYIDQECAAGASQIWMKSYNGNDVVYHAKDRTYTITKGNANQLTVKTKITILGETRYYDVILNFTPEV